MYPCTIICTHVISFSQQIDPYSKFVIKQPRIFTSIETLRSWPHLFLLDQCTNALSLLLIECHVFNKLIHYLPILWPSNQESFYWNIKLLITFLPFWSMSMHYQSLLIHTCKPSLRLNNSPWNFVSFAFSICLHFLQFEML